MRTHPLETAAIADGPRSGVWQGDGYRLMAAMPDTSVDLVLTSPPYWGFRDYGLDHNENILQDWKDAGGTADSGPNWEWYATAGGALGQEPLPEWYVSHVAEILAIAYAKLVPGGSLWLNVGDTYFARWSSIRESGRQGLGGGERKRRRTPSGGWRHDKQLLMLPARIAVAMQEHGWILRNDLIWSKPTPAPRPEKDRLRLSHEHFFHFVRRRTDRRPAYYYDLDEAEPGALDVVVQSPEAGEGGHTATFPTAMVTRRILSSSPIGGVVVDPFCGTGRALVAAVRSGRVAIGFELSTKFANLAASNLRHAEGERHVG
jgi:site-specific DNA-methyltransferase (cytosine-N4-specific)